MYLLGMGLVLPGAVNRLLCWVGSETAGILSCWSFRKYHIQFGLNPCHIRALPLINFSTSHLGNRPKLLLSFICLLIGEVAKNGRVLHGAEALGMLEVDTGDDPCFPNTSGFCWGFKNSELLINYKAESLDSPPKQRQLN